MSIDLKKLYAEHPECFESSVKLKAYLKDLYPSENAKINIISVLLEEGVIEVIRKADKLVLDSFCNRINSYYGFASNLVMKCVALFAVAFELSKAERVRSLAESGDAEAQYELGNCYFTGDGVEKDYYEAVKWFILSAKQENGAAQYALRRCYARGLGVERDYSQSLDWLAAAYKNGNPDAVYEKGCEIYDVADIEDGEGGKLDLRMIASAMDKFSYASKAGHAESTYMLGRCCEDLYIYGHRRDDIIEALKYYETAAKQGSERAVLRLGKLRYKDKLDEWYIPFAKKGMPRVQEKLADFYFNRKEYDKARQWYIAILENVDSSIVDNQVGYRRIEYAIGQCYQYAVDYLNALVWYDRAKSHGHYCDKEIAFCETKGFALYPDNAELQYRMGERHYSGLCVDENGKWVRKDVCLPEAIKLYEFAVAQNHPKALCKLAYCYAVGKGCDCDDKKAHELYKKAAALGIADAEYHMGHSCEYGKLEPKNLQTAEKWYALAAEHGNALAMIWLGDKCLYEWNYEPSSNEEDDEIFDEFFDLLDDPFDDSEDNALCTPVIDRVEKQKILSETDRVWEVSSWREATLQAAQWYKKASDAIATESLSSKIRRCCRRIFNHLRHIYLDVTHNHYERKAILDVIQQVADYGFKEVQILYGDICRYGLWTGRDEKTAVAYYQKAQDYALGECYQFGIGVKKDIERAISVFERTYKTDEDRLVATIFDNVPKDLNGIEFLQKSVERRKKTAQKHFAEDSGFIVEGSVLAYYDGNSQSPQIPNIITEIADGAFAGCTTVKKIVIPNSVTRIGAYSFYGCENLKSVIIGDGVTRICKGAFLECTSLTNVRLPEHLAAISEKAFAYCRSLEKIEIPCGDIENLCFCGCRNLEKILLGKLCRISNDIFYDCPRLKEVEYGGNKKFWDGTLYRTNLFASCINLPTVLFTAETPDIEGEVLDIKIEDLDLSVRAVNCLKRAKIITVGDIVAHTEEELLKVRNLGRRALDEVIEKIHTLGLKLIGE